MIFAITAAEDLELHQLDIKTRFLNDELVETINMKQPDGFRKLGPDTVCHTKKSLYGLRQAPRAWQSCLKQELNLMSFKPSDADPGFTLLSTRAG